MSKKDEIKAIVYTSNAGHTKEYAELLGKETGLMVLDLKNADRNIPAGSEIIYLGWLMAGQIKGYKSAKKKFNIKAVCGVGMAQTGSQLTDIRKTNGISENLPVFCLQGGLELEKLHGIYKFMMSTMKKTAGKGLKNKADRTPQEDEMLELLENGGNKVNVNNLEELLRYIEG